MNIQTIDTEINTEETLTARERRREPLGTAVRTALDLYFKNLNGHKTGNIYQMVMAEVEKPLLESVMGNVKNNQSKAAQILGISRSTLRKKLKQYDLD
ncbi:MAG: DNA-binding transcriptional regulator Fis [Gammaproteobacteria bacterium]|nr:MAG: DNA-binding transcriptional regulator Fis [Gammaproteobacteria bacterium]